MSRLTGALYVPQTTDNRLKCLSIATANVEQFCETEIG